MIFWLVLWRVFLFVFSIISSSSFTPQFPYADVYLQPSGLPQWIWGWANFDGVHYLSIAKGGYAFQFTQAFFPVFPLLLRALGWFIRDEFMILSGLMISFICFLGAMYMFRKLLNLDWREKGEVRKIIIMLLIFPTSYYFGALYTESLFFLLVLSAFYFVKKKQWWLAGIIGAIASGTRITGILLLPALLWEVYKLKSQKLNVKTTTKNLKVLGGVAFVKDYLHFSVHSPITYLAPIGLLGYMAYLQSVFKDALYFWHAQPVFGAERSGGDLIFPLQTVWRYVKILISVSYTTPQFWIAFWELGALTLAVILLLVAHKQKVRLSYLIFSWLVIIIPTLTGTLSSIPRYILLAFPMYMVLGRIRHRWVFYYVSLTFITLQIFFISRFIQGLWVA